MGFGVVDLGFSGLLESRPLGVPGLGLRAWAFGFRACGLGFRAWGLGLGHPPVFFRALGFGVSGLVRNFGFEVFRGFGVLGFWGSTLKLF